MRQTNYALIRHQEIEPKYTPAVAAALAGISLQQLEAWRRAGLVAPKVRVDGTLGYGVADIRRLHRIRRLQTELGLDLGAVEVVLHLRSQVQELQREMQALRQAMVQREESMLHTIRQLRRQLADDTQWR